MSSVAEQINSSSQLNAALQAGIDTIDRSESVTFTKYVRLVLPFDGYVFWVKADLLSKAALYNRLGYNTTQFNEALELSQQAPTLTVAGSLHYATETKQEETQTYAVNRVLFTAKSEIQDFNALGDNVIYIGTFEEVDFAFAGRRSYFEAAGDHHYWGDAIYPAMRSQIVDDPRVFDTANVIVSNSLPVWLTLTQYCPIFPSFAVPPNLQPPYGVVHIAPDTTAALAAGAYTDQDSNHYQLVTERARVTLCGLRNFNAIDFVDYVTQYALNTENMGVMNAPVPRDEKATQRELGILAMKKVYDFDVCYYQTRIRDIARQSILTALLTPYIESASLIGG